MVCLLLLLLLPPPAPPSPRPVTFLGFCINFKLDHFIDLIPGCTFFLDLRGWYRYSVSTPSSYLQTYQPYTSLFCRVNAGSWEAFTPSTIIPLFVLLLNFCCECLQGKIAFSPSHYPLGREPLRRVHFCWVGVNLLWWSKFMYKQMLIWVQAVFIVTKPSVGDWF